MSRKRAREGDGESIQQMRKKIKIETPANEDENFNEVPDAHGTSPKRKPKKESKKKKEKQSENEEDHREETSELHPRKSQQPYRKKARGMNLSRVTEILNFNEAKKLIMANPHCGLKALREKRHITLPYHLIGGNINKSCEFIAKMTIGKYRPKVRGVVISIGSVRLASLPRVIDDQNVFHLDIVVTQAVFRPVVGHSYEARVTHISDDFLSALILEAISINAPVDDKLREKLRGIVLEVDDVIEVKHKCLAIKRGMCQLRGKFVRILRKGIVKTETYKDSDQSSGKSKNQKTFADSDDEG